MRLRSENREHTRCPHNLLNDNYQEAYGYEHDILDMRTY